MKDEETGGGMQLPQTVAARTTVSRNIVVNGRTHLHSGDAITTRELARLAYPEDAGRSRSALTVAYEGGPLDAQSGLMAANASTPVTEGQRFSVSLTDKS